MRVQVLQHVDFEGPAAIRGWAEDAGHTLACTRLDRGERLPEISVFDFLVVMGGPMSVNDEDDYGWLRAQKRLVRNAIEAGRAVLGVCLGAQLIASALGARVYRAREKEIGWFPVRRVSEECAGALLPPNFTPLHWHGETFDLPQGAQRLAETEAVPNQAFQIGQKVVGLQFHLEATPQSVAQLVEHAAHEIRAGERFQQAPDEIVAQAATRSREVTPMLYRLLDYLSANPEARTAPSPAQS